jgi:cytochrome c oxidase subunit I+III
MAAATRQLPQRNAIGFGFVGLVFVSLVALLAALTLEFLAPWTIGLRPDASSYAAMVYLNLLLQFQLGLALIVMAGFVLVRSVCRRLDTSRRVTFDNLALLHHYAIGQGLLGMLIIHGFPRLVLG